MNPIPRFSPVYVVVSSDGVIMGVYSCRNVAVVAKLHYEKVLPKSTFAICKQSVDFYDVEDYDII